MSATSAWQSSNTIQINWKGNFEINCQLKSQYDEMRCKDYPDSKQKLASVFTFSVNYFEYCSISQYKSYCSVLLHNCTVMHIVS